MQRETTNKSWQLVLAACSAFAVYFCMYAFRKPFTAATYEGHEYFEYGLKTVLVISQLVGYMLSKFIGVRVVSQMPRHYRAVSILVLIGIAELALIGFALAPLTYKPVLLFFNGLPLGMIFGLVLAYLEGRKQTEALSAALCASFIVSSGVVKSVGRWLIENQGLSDFQMPMVTGAIFLIPLLVSVWLLQMTPEPDERDRELRSERPVMNSKDRQRFYFAYWPGLVLMIFVYVALTIIRTIRDDFGVEIWRDMGIHSEPLVFTQSETWVAVIVTALNALAMTIKQNRLAIRTTVAVMTLSFGVVIGSAYIQSTQLVTPFQFMVLCGIGLYIPYVAFHTTIFERLIALSRHPGNLGFLMYLADAMGYLGYALVMLIRSRYQEGALVLPFFRYTLIIVGLLSIAALITATLYFERTFQKEQLLELPPSDSSELSLKTTG